MKLIYSRTYLSNQIKSKLYQKIKIKIEIVSPKDERLLPQAKLMTDIIVTGNLIKMLRLLKNTIFLYAVHRASDIIKT